MKTPARKIFFQWDFHEALLVKQEFTLALIKKELQKNSHTLKVIILKEHMPWGGGVFFLVRLCAQQTSKTIQNVQSLRTEEANDGSRFKKNNLKNLV